MIVTLTGPDEFATNGILEEKRLESDTVDRSVVPSIACAVFAAGVQGDS
jgi:hypothetical protein